MHPQSAMTLERLSTRARRQAARDYCDPPRWQGFKVTPLPERDCIVREVIFFGRVYSAMPDHVGTIEVQYAREGCCVLYGFTAAGELITYAD